MGGNPSISPMNVIVPAPQLLIGVMLLRIPLENFIFPLEVVALKIPRKDRGRKIRTFPLLLLA